MILTEPRAQLINALKPDSRYLLTRDSSKLSPNVRSILRGTHVVELVDGREVQILKAHMNAALEMVEEKFLEEVDGRPFGGRLYRLTDKGRAIEAHVTTRRGKAPRMLLSRLEAIAAEYDCKVQFVRGNVHWKLIRLSGQKIKYDALHTPDGKPAVRLADMTAPQWRESIKKCLKLNGVSVWDDEE